MSNPRFQCLALTGGGYRGLFTASALATIEAARGMPIARSFEILAGTSIGGIVALAAAFEKPMAEVVAVFKQHGPSIFPPEDRAPSDPGIIDYWSHRNTPRYRKDPLVRAIQALIPKGTLLGHALHPVLIPAVNLGQRGNRLQSYTRHLE